MSKKKKEKKHVENSPVIPKIPTYNNEVDDFYKMQFDSYLQKRKDECEGLEVCKKCGGVLWDLSSHGLKKCGDCGDVSGNIEGKDDI